MGIEVIQDGEKGNEGCGAEIWMDEWYFRWNWSRAIMNTE